MAGCVEGLVGPGLGKAGVAQQSQERGLPFVAGPLGCAARGAPQQADSAVPVGSGDCGLDGAVGVQAQPLLPPADAQTQVALSPQLVGVLPPSGGVHG